VLLGTEEVQEALADLGGRHHGERGKRVNSEGAKGAKTGPNQEGRKAGAEQNLSCFPAFQIFPSGLRAIATSLFIFWFKTERGS
jgi:hypothetical protein